MSFEHPTALRREQPIEKAARLLDAGRVLHRPSARVYDVVGDHDTYRVIATPQEITCPCPAHTSLCAHVLAVAMLRATPVRADEYSVRREVMA